MRLKRKIWKPAYIGLGSNLNEPLQQINMAIENIKKIPDSCYILSSNLYDS